MSRTRFTLFIFAALGVFGSGAGHAQMPGTRTITDAHNCYPYGEWWSDRITRAISTGMPVAIEQDLNWYVPARGGRSRVVVGHGGALTGKEPEFEHYFFDSIQPQVESALLNPDHSQWPLITLNLDFKTEEPEMLRAVWVLLEKHEAWLTTAERASDGRKMQTLKMGPVLVLNGPSDAQQKVFYDDVPVGARLLTFGAVPTSEKNMAADPRAMETMPATNYRRWWNNPWTVVEPQGQPRAGKWSAASDMRLREFVSYAHQQGLWIRFYTLDGATEAEESENGWFHQYSFGSFEAAKERWVSAIADGVDYIASDQYEELGKLVHDLKKVNRSGNAGVTQVRQNDLHTPDRNKGF